MTARRLALAAVLAAATAAAGMELDLAGEWRLRQVGGGVTSSITIPGDVHSAIATDLFYGANETNYLWIGRTDWSIAREFTVPEEMLLKREVVLRLEDCDTFAVIRVNGREVGCTCDRFQRYTFDVKAALRPGTNTIEGVFRAPETEADERRTRLGRAYPMSNVTWAKNQALIRKPACHAGWDWGPSVQVIGFCGEVRLLASDAPRVEYVYTDQRFNADLTHCTLTVIAELSDGSRVEKTIEIDDPPLWWPNGQGEPRLYEYAIEVNGETVRGRTGLRKLEVLNERTVSADGQEELSLVFRVNHRRVFMKGANWIPCDAYERRQTPERYRALVAAAKAANMNMLRVWGGGQYEKDAFYAACDEAGILLWHDFMCACAVYPAEEWFLDELRGELAHQLRRLRDHPSIALWCGDNECLGAIRWFPESKAEPEFYREAWRRRSEVQAAAVRQYDPSRTYWPSSPCCGPGDFGNAWKDDSKGDMHNWDVWHDNREFAAYYEYAPRFCSEFGYQSFPSLEVAATFATPAEIADRGPGYEWHQKNPGGNRRIRETMARYFRPVRDSVSELLLSQFQQAMAIRMAVDGWRALRPRCMGTLYWQLNDNWPVASWSSIEYGGKWKPLHYLARRFYAPLAVVAGPDGRLTALNDLPAAVTGRVRATYYAFTGEVLSQAEWPVELPPGSAVRVAEVVPREDAVLALELKTSQGDFAETRMFGDYRALPGEKPKLAVKVEGFTVTLLADRPAFWVWANASGIAGEFDDNAITLLPGQARRLVFTPADPGVTPAEFAAQLTVTHLAELTE